MARAAALQICSDSKHFVGRGGRQSAPLTRAAGLPTSLIARNGRTRITIAQSSSKAEAAGSLGQPPPAPARGRSPTPAPVKQGLPYNLGEESSDEFTECSASFVFVSNEAHPAFTRLSIDVPDSPGLLRTITWVLNGMGMRVQNATLSTADDGTVHDIFWLTTWAGKKLTEVQATLLAERVEDFVVACAPKATVQTEWQCKNIRVSNTVHPKYTMLIVEGEPQRHGFLLELASVLSGTGLHVKEAHIQSGPVDAPPPGTKLQPGGEDWPVDTAPAGFDYSGGRYFKFLLAAPQGGKLDPATVGALLFCIDVFTGQGSMPLVAPNLDQFVRNGAPRAPLSSF